MTCSGTLCVFDKVHTDALFSYAATLPGKTRKHENTSFRFSLKAALLQLPNFNQSALDIYNLVDSQFILVLLPEINGNQF